MTSTLVVAVGAFAAWVHLETRDRWATFMLVATYALLPGTLLHDLEILSEFPYLTFSLLALWLASRADTTQRGNRLVAVFVGVSAVTRTVGLSLIVAMAFWLFSKRGKSRVVCLLVAAAPGIAWSVYKSLYVGAAVGGSYQQFWIDLLRLAREQGIATFLPSFVVGAAVLFLARDIENRGVEAQSNRCRRIALGCRGDAHDRVVAVARFHHVAIRNADRSRARALETYALLVSTKRSRFHRA